jgi:probable phosphoglycerate mutase
MPILLLIRHGENDYVKQGKLAGRLPGVCLNETGRQQAQRLAELLSKAPLKAVYASPLERALETAAPLAQAHGLDVQVRSALVEIDIGAWTDQPLKALRRRREWKTVQLAPSRFRFPGGETFAECQQRMVNELEALCQLHADKDILACVSHADPIKLAVAYYLGLPLDHFQRLSVSPGSITALQLGENNAVLLALNSYSSFHK